jgi:NAD+ kinase
MLDARYRITSFSKPMSLSSIQYPVSRIQDQRIIMKRVAIIFNPEKGRAKIELSKIKTWLIKRKCQVFTMPSSEARIEQHFDFALTLGGDGTMLKAGKMVSNIGIPVLGINLGTLGFLAETDSTEVYDLLPDIIEGRFSTEDRMMLDVSIRSGKIIYKKQALNDVVINSGNTGRIIKVAAKLDDEYLAEYAGDGVIIASPTGSTAYSLAAHGPIVHPHLSVFIITPICPHTLTQRPLIISSKHTLSFHVTGKNSPGKPVVSIDGQNNYPLDIGEEILVTSSSKLFKMIVNPKRKYLNVLRTKLKWGERIV